MLVSFSIGRYEDEVLCDVVPMQARHLLLGRPCQFDRHVFHDVYKNRYTIEKDDKKFNLAPLTPQHVQTSCEYREAMKKEIRVKKDKEKNKCEKDKEENK